MLNIEFKAKVENIAILEAKLKTLAPTFIGIDHQIDTYFNVPKHRLKLREGNIENALIYYERENTAASKESKILLYQHQPNQTLKQILIETLGIKVVVDKQRSIYFIDNVKFHFDTLKNFGTFVEVEAIDKDDTIGKEKLQQQCDYYFNFFALKQDQLQQYSYSDLLLAQP